MEREPKPFSRIADEAIAQFRRIPDPSPKAMRKRPTVDLAAIVEALRVKHGLGRDVPEDALRNAWPELVGPANAEYSHPMRIDYGKRLVVLTSHSVVRNEIFMNRDVILERIQRLPGCGGLTELRLVNQ